MKVCTNCGEAERDCCCKMPELVEYAETERDDLMQILARSVKQGSALLTAGKALDAAMMKLTGDGDGRIHIIRDAELVDQMHQALNRVAAVIGTPWREEK